MTILNNTEKELLAKVLSMAIDNVETNELDSLVAIAVKNDLELDEVFKSDVESAKEALPF